MKKMMLAALLVLALLMMSGCQSATQALARIGDDIEAAQLKSPKDNSASKMDWSFVPVVRDMATKMFAEGVPDAKIVDTRVASKTNTGERAIVVIEIDRAGKRGTYGFDYEKNAQGEYELKRLGEGVRTDDLN